MQQIHGSNVLDLRRPASYVSLMPTAAELNLRIQKDHSDLDGAIRLGEIEWGCHIFGFSRFKVEMSECLETGCLLRCVHTTLHFRGTCPGPYIPNEHRFTQDSGRTVLGDVAHVSSTLPPAMRGPYRPFSRGEQVRSGPRDPYHSSDHSGTQLHPEE